LGHPHSAARLGYISASIEWASHTGQPEAWKAWWDNPAARIYNFLGKDNIPFHTVLWPAQLLGVGTLNDEDATARLNLPYDVPANAFMTLNNAQFSKSRQRAVWLPDLLAQYDPDAIRYAITAVLPESDDSDFSWTDFGRRINDELIAAWGNLAHRVLTFAVTHWDGHVPAPGALTSVDQALLTQVDQGFTTAGALLEAVKLRAALHKAMGLARTVKRSLGSLWDAGCVQVPKRNFPIEPSHDTLLLVGELITHSRLHRAGGRHAWKAPGL
jgi:methionyl-tRNA synthetase